MTSFTLTYANLDDPTATLEYTVDAINERWAMAQAMQMLKLEPGSNAWVLQSVVQVSDTTTLYSAPPPESTPADPVPDPAPADPAPSA